MIPLVRQTFRRACTVLIPSSWIMFRGPQSSRSVALTFDDGPDPDHTPVLLDALAAEGIQATFFVIGENAKRLPHLIGRMAGEGHSVGHHSWTHSDPKRTSFVKLAEEVRSCRSLLEDLLGRPCGLFRPPQGRLTIPKAVALWRLGQHIVQWTVDSGDCRVNSAAEAMQWAESFSPHSGDIVLLHDDYSFAPSLISPIAEQVRSAGLGFATIEEWLEPVASGSGGTRFANQPRRG